MYRLKKFFTGLVAVALVGLAVFQPQVQIIQAADITVVSLGAADEIDLNTEFTVSIGVSDVTLLNAANYRITYDPEMLSLSDVTDGMIGSTTIPVDGYNEVSDGVCNIVNYMGGLTGVSGSGTLAVLHFRTLNNNGITSIDITGGVLSDTSANAIEATWTGISIQVGSGTTTTTSTTEITTTRTTYTRSRTTTTTRTTTTGTTTENTTTVTTTTQDISPVTTTVTSTTSSDTETTQSSQTTTPTTTTSSPPASDFSDKTDGNGQLLQDVVVGSNDNNVSIILNKGNTGHAANGEPLTGINVNISNDIYTPVPGGFSLCGNVYDFDPDGATFDEPVTITFTYDPEAVTDNSELAVWRYDSESHQWVSLGGVIDTVNHTVTVQVDHFSSYAIVKKIPVAVITTSISDTNTNTGLVTSTQPGGTSSTGLNSLLIIGGITGAVMVIGLLSYLLTKRERY